MVCPQKAFEFVDFYLKVYKQSGSSYIRDSNDFINKIKSIKNIASNLILIRADFVGLYTGVPFELGLNGVREKPCNGERKSIPSENILKMLNFVLKNNYFEFNGKVKQQLSGSSSKTKRAPPYAFIFIWIK